MGMMAKNVLYGGKTARFRGQYGEGCKGLLLTMMVPTILTVLARWAPQLFRRRR